MIGRPRKLWAGLEHDWLRQAAVRQLSPAAKLLFIAGRLYSSEHLTDGMIEGAQLSMLAAEANVSLDGLADELVAAGLWEMPGDGSIHDVDYLTVNQKAASRLERWQKERDRKAQSQSQRQSTETETETVVPRGKSTTFHAETPEIPSFRKETPQFPHGNGHDDGELGSQDWQSSSGLAEGQRGGNEAFCGLHARDLICDLCRQPAIAQAG